MNAINRDYENDKNIFKGEIYLVDLSTQIGCEQSGFRPAVIVPNNIGNRCSHTTIICPLTSQHKNMGTTHVLLSPSDCGVIKTSTVLCEQVRVIDKSRIVRKVGEISNPNKLADIDRKIMISFGITT